MMSQELSAKPAKPLMVDMSRDQDGPDYIECSVTMYRWLIVLACGGDPYLTTKELYNAGFRGHELRLSEWGHA